MTCERATTKGMEMMQASLRSALRDFFDSEDGVAASEFALMLPVLLALWAGFTTVGELQSRTTMLNNATATLSDLVAQGDVTNKGMLDTAINTASLLLKNSGEPGFAVIGITIPGNKDQKPRVAWSYNEQGVAPYARNSQYDKLPPALTENRPTSGGSTTFVIIAEGKLNYKPFFGSGVMKGLGFADLNGKFDLAHRTINAPRNTTVIKCINCP